MKRVVVTGVGVVSPCGKNAATTWENVVAGRSGIRPIVSFDASDITTTFGGECWDFDPSETIAPRKQKEMARFTMMAMAASREAIESSGFEPSDELKERTGTFIGVGFCGMEVVEEQHERLMAKGPRRVSPYFIPSAISNLAPGQVSMEWGYKGPSLTTTSACSSGAHALGEAFRWIQYGRMDAAVAGGAEAALTRLGLSGFASMRALSKRNDEPTKASRPFDADRDGFVMSEGAGILMLEEREGAIKRGANILAELVGYGATADAYHITQPAPNHEGAQRSMRECLQDAKLDPSSVGYVNAHGTSTPAGDAGELTAVREVFGEHAAKLSISSTKSSTGHLLGAAGGIEAVFAVQSIANGVVPPTMNLDNPDPAGDGLDLVPHEAKERSLDAVLSNSFGFGGTNASLIFRRHT
ncbi:MAG: 3-oxoacyl-[acyl-carrier-protein] synthase II [Polyangiales bacterium]|jgi:3-oxoacyl-[acyl-carrier-protein] synthase II